jgi:hypothetical protein
MDRDINGPDQIQWTLNPGKLKIKKHYLGNPLQQTTWWYQVFPWQLIRVQNDKDTPFFQTWQVQNHLHKSLLLDAVLNYSWGNKNWPSLSLLICSTATTPHCALLTPSDVIIYRCSLSFSQCALQVQMAGGWIQLPLTMLIRSLT